MQAPEPVKRQADAEPESVPAYFSHWLILFTAVAALVFAAKWWSGDAPAGPPAPAALAEAESARSTSPAAVSDAPAPGASGPRVADPEGAWSEAESMATQMDVRGVVFTASGEPVGRPDPEVLLRDIDRVRAPAQVPYPRRTETFTALIPETANGRRGIVILTLLIAPDGQVVAVDVLRSVDPALDASAVDAAWRWRFAPTVQRGKPVAVVGNFSVPFPSG